MNKQIDSKDQIHKIDTEINKQTDRQIYDIYQDKWLDRQKDTYRYVQADKLIDGQMIFTYIYGQKDGQKDRQMIHLKYTFQ